MYIPVPTVYTHKHNNVVAGYTVSLYCVVLWHLSRVVKYK